MKKCITRSSEGKFEVHSYDGEVPNNYVISEQNPNTSYTAHQYCLAENDIIVRWGNGAIQGHRLVFSKNNVPFKTVKDPNLQIVCDYLNKYATMSDIELNELIEQAQQQTKSELEKEIEKLKIEKEQLQEELDKIKTITSKSKEVIELLKSL